MNLSIIRTVLNERRVVVSLIDYFKASQMMEMIRETRSDQMILIMKS